MKDYSVYKGSNLVEDSFKNKMYSYFNPYEYNFESNLKDRPNTDIMAKKSKSHTDRNKQKK